MANPESQNPDARHRSQQELTRLLKQFNPAQGLTESPIERLSLIRSDSPTQCMATVYEPALDFLIQGRKHIELGDRPIEFSELSYLITAVHLPVSGQVLGATPEQPFLAMKLKLDPKTVTDLLLQMGAQAPGLGAQTQCSDAVCGMGEAKIPTRMLNALSRLMGLLEHPEDIPVMAPMITREIIYYALQGELGPRMRRLAATDSHASRVANVIAMLNTRFTQALRVSEMAEHANMSESALFHSFKQTTRMTPLQYQKKLRLHEARRLMLSEGMEAASASYRVGYESPSQFSREYSRLFGSPPRADITRLRSDQQVPA